MSVGRVVLLVTCLVVAVLAAVLAVLQWQQANKIATVVMAMAGVAAVGVGVWAGLSRPAGPSVRVSRTGPATSGPGGRAISGAAGPLANLGSVEVDQTGAADASGGGKAVTGVDPTDQ
jgi:hypothetical protein